MANNNQNDLFVSMDSTPHCCDSLPDLIRQPRLSALVRTENLRRKTLSPATADNRIMQITDDFRSSTIATEVSLRNNLYAIYILHDTTGFNQCQ